VLQLILFQNRLGYSGTLLFTFKISLSASDRDCFESVEKLGVCCTLKNIL
jgi:hypothetical protein